MEDRLLKDFMERSECSDWFSREDVPKAQVMVPNPRNVEHDAKITELEERIQRLVLFLRCDTTNAMEEVCLVWEVSKLTHSRASRLKQEKAAWLALRKPPPDVPPLFTPDTEP